MREKILICVRSGSGAICFAVFAGVEDGGYIRAPFFGDEGDACFLDSGGGQRADRDTENPGGDLGKEEPNTNAQQCG